MTTNPRLGGCRSTRVALAAVALLGLTACTGSGSSSATSDTPAPSTTLPSSSAPVSPTPTVAPVGKNPYTGLGAVPRTPAIVVKIDDTAPGRPQLGIDKADIVYIEAVEAGYTRLAAIFGTNKPTVGYVRSTRPSDPDLFRQYGKITEAFSGGQKVSRDLATNAGLNTWDFGSGASYFFRVDRSESTYINLELDLAKVAKAVRTPRPKANGWTFDPSLAGLPATTGTNLRTTVTGSYPISSGTPVQFKWNAGIGKYVRYIDGVAQHAADGKLVTATNVVVQSCEVHSFNADRDVNGYPAQFTTTVGAGAVAVFRQGKRVDGTWSRATTTAGTTLKASNGAPLSLNPGNTWVVLIRKGVPVRG